MVYQKKNPERKRYMHLTDLTPQVIDTLIGDIRDGNYFITACRAAGIDRKSAYNWRKKGEELLDKLENGEAVTDTEQAYINFYLSIDQADAEGEILLVRDCRNKLDGWQASMRVLEAKYPDRWARTERQEISGRGGEPLFTGLLKQLRDLDNAPEKS
jgi:hypothetical protein